MEQRKLKEIKEKAGNVCIFIVGAGAAAGLIYAGYKLGIKVTTTKEINLLESMSVPVEALPEDVRAFIIEKGLIPGNAAKIAIRYCIEK